MSKTISNTLKAAKELLWAGEGKKEWPLFICHAINIVSKRQEGDCDHPAIQLLAEAGMPLHGGAFQDMMREARLADSSENKQIWRHAWLDLMIQFCEEEGL